MGQKSVHAQETHRAQLNFSVQILLGLGHIFEGWADNCLAHAHPIPVVYFSQSIYF